MIMYHSTRGGSPPVTFDQAVLQGFAGDGGLFVPHPAPRVSPARLEQWKSLDYVALAGEVMSCYIDPEVVPKQDLERLLAASFAPFEQTDPALVSPGLSGADRVSRNTPHA